MKKSVLFIISVVLAAALTLPNAVYADETRTDTVTADGESVDDENNDETSAAEPTDSPAETTAPEDDEGASASDSTETDEDDTDTPEGLSTEAGAAGDTGFDGTGFKDCAGHWAEEIIKECTAKEYLDGYEDGTFRPDNPVTAAEFSKIFSAWQGNFYSISAGYWATPYIRLMLDDGILEKDDYSDYGVAMTREMTAKAVVNYLKNENFPLKLKRYKELIPDIADADKALSDYVAKAYISGVMSGYEDGSFRPKNNVTRAEILSIIDRTMNADKREIPASVLDINSENGVIETTITVMAETAQVEGGMLNIIGSGEDAYVENFRTDQKMTFKFNADAAGTYKMKIYYSANVNSGGGTVTFDVNGDKFDHEFAQTGAWNLYVYEDLGEVTLNEGENTLILTDKEIPNTYLINVKHIVFEKAE